MNYCFLLILSLFNAAHDFHVSITEVQYRNQELQCTMRVFTDDLENRLEQDHNLKLKLGGAEEDAEADKLIALYLKEKFHLNAAGQRVELNFIGKEVDYEMTYLHFFFKCEERPKTIELSNRLFFDSFDDQSNIVNVRVDGTLRSAFFTAANPNRQLEF